MRRSLFLLYNRSFFFKKEQGSLREEKWEGEMFKTTARKSLFQSTLPQQDQFSICFLAFCVPRHLDFTGVHDDLPGTVCLEQFVCMVYFSHPNTALEVGDPRWLSPHHFDTHETLFASVVCQCVR